MSALRTGLRLRLSRDRRAESATKARTRRDIAIRLSRGRPAAVCRKTGARRSLSAAGTPALLDAVEAEAARAFAAAAVLAQACPEECRAVHPSRELVVARDAHPFARHFLIFDQQVRRRVQDLAFRQ